MAGPNESPNRKYAYLEQLSMERLEEMLTLDADPLSDQEDEEYIDAILEVTLKREKEHPTGRLTDVDKAWEDFQKYYNTPEGEGISLYPNEDVSSGHPIIQNPTPIAPRVKRNRLKRLLLSAAVVACLIVFGLPPAMGYTSFLEMIGQWTESVFHFAPQATEPNQSAEGNNNPGLLDEYDNLHEAVDAYGFSENIVPTWVPEGFVSEFATVNSFPEFGETEFSSLYTNKDGQSISILIVKRATVEVRSYEKDGNPLEEYIAGDVTHYIFENNGQLTAAWYNEFFECSIVTDITLDDLEKILDSIYER